MKKITKNVFWLMISVILLVVHFLLCLTTGLYDYMLPYVTGIIITLIVGATSLHRMEKLMKEDMDLYGKIMKNIIKKWWFWIHFFFIFIFLLNTLFFLGQLFLDENDIYTKVTFAGSPYYGCLLSFITNIFGSMFITHWTYRKMMENTIEK